MYLVKFTSKKWSQVALKGVGLKIGTTKHYREIEDARFRDEDEGGGRLLLQPNRKVYGKDLNRIFGHEGVQFDDDLTVDLSGTSLLGERSQFNTNVFCCSCTKDLSEIEGLASRFEADDYFFISDPTLFRRAIGEQLKSVINEYCRNNIETLGVTDDIIDTLEVWPMLSGVEYTDEPKTRIVTEENIKVIEPQQFDVVDFFQKPTKFEPESEMRFLWPVTHRPDLSDKLKGVNVMEEWRIVTSENIGISREPVNLDHSDISDNRGRPVRLPRRVVSRLNPIAQAVKQGLNQG